MKKKNRSFRFKHSECLMSRQGNPPECSVLQEEAPGTKNELTWCEKLELLRAVNKPKEKTKVKMPRLKYIKDMVEPIPEAREPGRAHLYEQRRIKHLLQQVRMKGKEHFDWLKDREHPLWKSADESDSDSSDSFSDEERFSRRRKEKGLTHEDGVVLNRYKVKPVIRGVKTLSALQRTNTEIFKD